MKQQRFLARQLAFQALLFALVLILQWIDLQLPPLPVPAPVRLGLANIVILYSLTVQRFRETLMLVLLKSAFVLLTRGLLAAALSLAGGLLACLVMGLLYACGRKYMSWLLLSCSGALAHQLGQLLMLALMMPFVTIFRMAPILAILGTITGAVTAILLWIVMPALIRINKENR